MTDALQLARSEILALQAELQQAQEARAFIVSACHEAQDIAAGLQSERAELLAAQARITLLADVNTELSSALLDVARRVEALKRPCGMDPESAQAIRNGEYMSIALAARAALLSPSGADPVQRPGDPEPGDHIVSDLRGQA